jgi:transcriptional regulator with XRE-family HTH domain
MAPSGTSAAGALLRQWRVRRGLSQLELSAQTGISARHASFVETGRARPSRELVQRLSDHLEVPIRERNQLLVAAGYAPDFDTSTPGDAAMAAVRAAVRVVLDGHGSIPAIVVDRAWNVMESNPAVALLLQDVDPELLEPPVNSMRVAMHPRGMAPRIRNLGQWRASVLDQLRRQVNATGSAELAALHDELSAYPGGDEGGSGDGVAIPMMLEVDGEVLSFLMTIATFGTPLDVAVSDLVIESFYPADESTAEYLARRAAQLSMLRP